MRALSAIVATGALACGSAQVPLDRAGGSGDDGAGELARASLHLVTPGEDERALTTEEGRPAARIDPEGGEPYGGDAYGGSPYGGSGSASWRVPQWNYTAPNRNPRYRIDLGLTGTIEGAVSWSGTLPAIVTSSCGQIAHPTLHVSPARRVRGVIVYVDKIDVGRATPYYARPATVGGTIAKHGCALGPAAQIVAPLPGAVAIHGDAQRARLRVAPPAGPARTFELEEAGLAQLEVQPGVTKVEAEDRKMGAAWVIGLDTPYYAITDDAGRYRIDELAPGTYEVTFWQPPVGTIARDGTWSYGAPIVARRTVSVGASPVSLSVTLRR